MKLSSSLARLLFVSALCFGPNALPQAAGQWFTPTADELKMTCDPHVPGAPAIYLDREEATDDGLHSWHKYARIKVLTEGGKDYGTVELDQFHSSVDGNFDIAAIAGRTIHPDGTVIPFTGKPYERLVEKRRGYKEVKKVFTLPEVQVGSIIEYRYDIRYPDNEVVAPTWIIQSDLYTRHAHYVWFQRTKRSHSTHRTETRRCIRRSPGRVFYRMAWRLNAASQQH